MRLHRFIGNFELSKLNFKVKDEELLGQISNVLRLIKGEEVVLADGKLNEARTRIAEMGRDFIEFEVLERWQNKNEPELDVILYCAILKKENFELVVQKATEIGVKEIVPITTGRTIKLNIRQDRLEKIIKEAAEQSGRGILPVLHTPIDLEKAVVNVDKTSLNLFFDQSGLDLNSLKLGSTNYKLVTIFIGPEGGWSPGELKTAETANFQITSLGKTTLRAETAAIVGSYLAIDIL